MAVKIVGRLRHIPVGLTRATFSLRAKIDAIRRKMAELKIIRPLRAGQQAVHNKKGFNYDHRNAADLGIHPNSTQGLSFRDFLEKNRIPYQAFTGPWPGASTGPHIHIGFPSQKTTKKYPIGTMI